jgi:DnaJ-like protein
MSSVSFSCFFIFATHNPLMGAAGYRPRFGKDIRIKPEAPVRAKEPRSCAKRGCEGEGAFRVPRSRERLDEHLWFCLQHAREHNETWDYFQGMSEAEIEAFRVDAVTGHRPTWALGRRTARAHGDTSGKQDYRSFRDSHRLFGDAFEAAPGSGANGHNARPLTGPQARALDVLNLEAGANLHQIKARYKELVKRFHPDANGGDRGAEERLKQVIKAYGVLRASGLT